MKSSKTLAKITAIVLVCFITVGLALPVISSATAQDDFKNAQAELDRIAKELNNIKSETKKQEAKKKNAQSQINYVKQQIALLNTAIDETGERLALKQEELDKKKVEIHETDELFKEKLRAMYIKKHAGGAMATALAVESFSELMTASNTMQVISEADTELLKRMDEERKMIEEAEAKIKEEFDALEQQKASQEEKQKELAGLLQVVNAALSDQEAKEAAASDSYEEKLAIYNAAKEAVQKEYELNGGVGDFVGGDWAWPVPNSRTVGSRFGGRTLFGKYDWHTGQDIPAPKNTPIVASNSGVVTVSAYGSTGYGNRIIIDHGGNNKTLYAHCNSLAVTVGQFVTKGQTIAYVGTTGLSTGNHLHFEIRMNGVQIDPLPYIQNN